MAAAGSVDYEKSVFINCPFDAHYKEMFEATIFAIMECGFVPRCALELSDGAQVRIERISKIIESCKFAIHDISRTDLDPDTNLPRFNMPLELGLFLGCIRFGSKRHKTKSCIIVDKELHRYQKFISDIAGQDISSHENDPSILINKIRDWLRPHADRPLLGGDQIAARYKSFRSNLPTFCQDLGLDEKQLTFTDLVYTIKYKWSAFLLATADQRRA